MKFDDLKFKIISSSPNYDTFRYFPVGGATIRTASHGEREREKERKRKKEKVVRKYEGSRWTKKERKEEYENGR